MLQKKKTPKKKRKQSKSIISGKSAFLFSYAQLFFSPLKSKRRIKVIRKKRKKKEVAKTTMRKFRSTT